MPKDEILIVKKEKIGDKLKFKICKKETHGWSPRKYEKVIANRDPNLLAYLFLDLENMGYKVTKAYAKYKKMLNEPDLFFLK